MTYLIITCSLNENNPDHIKRKRRLDRYDYCISSTLELIKKYNLNIVPIIVENNGFRETFLNKFKCKILYTNNNNKNLWHKGCKEMEDIKDAIKHFNIEPDDTIIKLTGRYRIYRPDFLNLVIRNNNNYKCFIKFFNVATKKYHINHNDCILGLFAIKSKYLLNFDNYKEKMGSPEEQFAIFVRDFIKLENVYKIESDLKVECNFNAAKPPTRLHYF